MQCSIVCHIIGIMSRIIIMIIHASVLLLYPAGDWDWGDLKKVVRVWNKILHHAFTVFWQSIPTN